MMASVMDVMELVFMNIQQHAIHVSGSWNHYSFIKISGKK